VRRPFFQKDQALRERDAASSERNAAIARRDRALMERDAALSERNAAIAGRDRAHAERDRAHAERDASLAALDGALAKRHASLAERNAARPELFDIDWYLKTYPDAAENPIAHFLNSAGNTDPGPFFSCSKYLKRYPDIARAGIHPFIHYIRFGRAEGRATLPSLVLEMKDGKTLYEIWKGLYRNFDPHQINEAKNVVLADIQGLVRYSCARCSL
jgi:hypothetical protein